MSLTPCISGAGSSTSEASPYSHYGDSNAIAFGVASPLSCAAGLICRYPSVRGVRSAFGPSPPASLRRLPCPELKSFAWLYAAAEPHHGFPSCSGSSSPCNNVASSNLTGITNLIASTNVTASSNPGHGSLSGTSVDGGHVECRGNSEPVTVASLVSNALKMVQGNCCAQMERFGNDKDSEVVHDLRVTLRRLRNMLRLFYPYLELENQLKPKKVSSLLRALGIVRDSGAMMETLSLVEKRILSQELSESALSEGIEDNEERAKPQSEQHMAALLSTVRSELLKREQAQLGIALKCLHNRQGKRFFSILEALAVNPPLRKPLVQVNVMAHAGSEGNTVEDCSDANPQPPTLSTCPANWFSPSLLAPYVSSVLLHPAWHIEEIWASRTNHSCDEKLELQPDIANPDAQLCEAIHDLRKHLRELRYAMELLEPVYATSTGNSKVSLGRHYKEALGRVKHLQGILGDLQDLQVLASFLREIQLKLKTQGKRKTSKRGKKFTKTHIGTMLEDFTEVQGTIVEMQSEVWEKWLVERNVISSTRGRYKLIKALLDKSWLNLESVNTDEGVDESGRNMLSSTPGKLKRAGEQESPDSDKEREKGQREETGPNSEGKVADCSPVPLYCVDPYANENTCTLWSSRPLVADWDDRETLPQNMLPALLKEIVLDEAGPVNVGLHPGGTISRHGKLHMDDKPPASAPDDGKGVRAK